jgi:hypothetical protein
MRILHLWVFCASLFYTQTTWANEISVSTVTAAAGQQSITVDIELTNSVNIPYFQFDLWYPYSEITFVSCEQGSHASNLTFGCNDQQNTPGEVVVLMVPTDLLNVNSPTIEPGTGIVTSITFDINSDAVVGDYILGIEGIVMSNWDLTEFEFTSVNGQITITEADEDGDGFSAAEDCDDNDPNIYPEAEDVWYDATDSDCAGNDDYDQDGDGFVPDEYVGSITAGIQGSGMLWGGDCDDTNANTYPEAEDIWYDGVDSDCIGNDDYDQDGDGFVPDEYVGLITAGLSDSGTLLGGDCDDSNEELYPNAVDPIGDDIDQNCDGVDGQYVDELEEPSSENSDEDVEQEVVDKEGGCSYHSSQNQIPLFFLGLLFLYRRK